MYESQSFLVLAIALSILPSSEEDRPPRETAVRKVPWTCVFDIFLGFLEIPLGISRHDKVD